MALLMAPLNRIRHAQEQNPQLIAKPLPESAPRSARVALIAFRRSAIDPRGPRIPRREMQDSGPDGVRQALVIWQSAIATIGVQP